MNEELPSSYTTLFGPIDHSEGNEARSVLSPAAYLVDLLELRDSLVSGWTGYHARRPDVRHIHLNQSNTFTEIPYLDIANEVMGALVSDGALAGRLFPPPLPFSEQHFRLKLYAEKLGTSLDELQRLYRSSVDAHVSARLRLGLSQEECSLFSTAHDSDDGIKALWGVDDPASVSGADVELIKKKLGVSLKELKQLVRQDLAGSELDAAASFFINQGSNYVVLDEGTPRLRLKDGSPLTKQHLDRMMRFVRLARRLSLELADLDWLLQTACGNTLDENGLQSIAIAVGIRTATDWPMDEICSLWSVPKSHGRGDGRLPADLFDRAYNNDFPITLKALVASLASAHATADALDDRLQAVLRLSGADFAFLKAALLARGVAKPPLEYTAVVTFFSAFRRIVGLSTLLSLSVQEVVMLLDVLGAQWTVSEHEDLTLPMPFSTAALTSSPLALLVQPDTPPRRTLDVLQKLLRVKEWLDLRQLSARQLVFICLEDHLDARQRWEDGSPIDDVQTDDAIETALDDLHQSLHDTMLTPSALQTGSLTADGASAVFEQLRDARVLVTFDDTSRALLRVQPSPEELAAAMQRGIDGRLTIHASDLGAVGLTDLEPLFSLLVSHGYAERREVKVGGETEVRHSIAPGLSSYFSSPSNEATFTIPNFQERTEALFSVLAQRVNAERVEEAALVATGLEASDVPALFEVLQARGYVEPVDPAGYRVATDARAFFQDPANLAKFVLPNFTTVFAVLATKVAAYQRAEQNREAEVREVGERLSALSEQQAHAWLRSLSGMLGLPEDLTGLVFAWAFGTPEETMTQTMAALTLPLFRARKRSEPALADAYLASRFRRLQQVALLLRKTEMSANEARVYLTNQQVHRRLPETLKVPGGFLSSGKVDALTTLPNGDFLLIGGAKYATFSRRDYHLLGTGPLDQIPGVTLPDAFRARVLANGLDAAFSDTAADGKPVLQLFAGDQYVTVSEAGTSPVKPLSDWGEVRNNIQQIARVDAAVQAKDGRLFLFSGDQYFLYSHPQQLLAGPAFVDERYPRSIRGKFEEEGVSPLPALMFSKVDAAFRDADDTYYFFSGNRCTHSTDPYNLVKLRPVWGRVLNHLFDEVRVDAAFVLGNNTYLTRRNQLIRYSAGTYQFVDEGFPISFGNIPDSEPVLRVLRRFPMGLDAALAGRDGLLYAFKDGAYASSTAPDTSLTIRDHWGRVRNVFVDNQRVDAALAHNGVAYLFCGDQYVRYSGPDYKYVDEGYPRRVRPNWNALEGIGLIPDGLPLPITAVAIDRAPSGTSDDVYFFGGNQYAGPGGTLGDVKTQWARVRNNVESTGVVDAAMLDGNGRMYLFSGDQFYRYSSPDQEFVDETYPRRISGNWVQEGSGYSLPDAFANGISAALRTSEGKVFFFSGQSYARVDAAPTAQPRANSQDWGVVRNWVQAQNPVDAAFVDPTGKTYMFGGDQFVRYSGASYDFVDEGYPLAIGQRWGNLPEDFRGGIDAVLSFKSPADNVQRLYLFKGDSYVRYSTSDYTQVDVGYPKRLQNAVKAEGSWFKGLAVHEPNPNSSHEEPILSVKTIYVDTFSGQPRICVFYSHEVGVQWKREYRNGKWQAPIRMEFINEYLPFKRVDSAFVSADGTLHVFFGGQYASRPPAGGSLSTPVPIRSRWARVWNQFADLGRVDACLSMGDGRTYLFCANQYIKYTGALRPGSSDFFVDEGYPKRIDPNWPNEGVPVALAPEFQAAGDDLCRDATGKVHVFKGTRYTFSGNAGTDVPLTSRWGRVENRFRDLGRVDGAYRAENGKLYLFCDTQYTRYSGALQPGSPDFHADEGYPRHVTSGWSSEGLAISMPDKWNALGSAVFRDTQQTYVFSGASFTSSQTPAPAPVIPRWADVRNQMQSSNRVDAGLVLGQGANAVTLLFCDDQYVRYSGAYDGFVDEGYPKVIAHLPETEGVFAGLPSEFQSGVRAVFAGVDGVLHAFGPQSATATEPQRYVSSASPQASLPLNQKWGIVDNKLWDNEFVNAALRTEDGKLYLFSGDQYLRYSGADRTFVDEGYPRKVASSYAKEIGATALAPLLNQGVDAALAIGGTTFYFAQNQYVGTDHPDVAQPLVNQWGRIDNRIQAGQKLDAAFVAPNGKLYLFAQSQYSVYSGAGRQYVDEEFPRNIGTDIGRLWPHDGTDFRSDLGTAATFEGRSYLFKGSRHVRISDFRLVQPDAGYPLDNAGKLVDRFDFELGTLPDWWRLKQLFDDHSSQTTTVLDYLDDPTLERVSGLARATQWPMEELNALLAIFSLQPNALLDGRTVVRLARCFELVDRLGTTPSKLKSQLWDLVFGSGPSQLQLAADFLYGLIKVATSPREWPGVARSLLDPLESAKRDALVAYLVESLDKQDANDLYEHLLTDIQMDASTSTSRIVEAINSIQLFYHRALIHLEELPDTVRENLKAWWPWMKNYRIWEANRKVFLHPENYIRPELRPEKSPAFEELEQKLLQDEITAISVQEGYQRYLESFNEISRLRIVGGYRYTYQDDSGTDRMAIFMIGVSRTDPPIYYYRVGALTPEEQIDWDPWEKIDITIDSDRVHPVYAFNRLFIFWIETKPFNAASFSTSGDHSYSSESDEVKRVKLTLKYSFYNFNKEWVAPQAVRINPDDPADPEVLPTSFSADAAADVQLTARNPVPAGGGTDDYIYLAFRFLLWEWNVGKLTAGLDLQRPEPSGRGWKFMGFFSRTDPAAQFPTQIGIQLGELSAIVPWGEHLETDTEDWFSFDAKGGTFLCRPMNATPPAPGTILGRAFATVSAAVRTSAGDVFVFTTEVRGGVNKLCYYHYVRASRTWRQPVFVGDPAWPWGRPVGVFQAVPARRIQNVVVAQDDTTYFLLGTEHFTYPKGSYDATAEHYAKELKQGSPTLEQLIGAGVPTLSWTDSVVAGRSLVRAFKHPSTAQVVLVTRADGTSGAATVSLDDLRKASADKDGHSPFDGWDGLDTVFQLNAPEPRIVFSRGTQLVILTWSSKAWSTDTLGTLPGAAPGLSAAFSGVDGKLYFFCGDKYAEVNPANLNGNQVFLPVGARWGRPSLFSWLLTSVDGALFGPDGKLYLFSGEYCLRYSGFEPSALGSLVLDDGAADPPKVPEVWRSPSGNQTGVERVTAAFERNGRVYLFGQRRDGAPFTARYSQASQSPFDPDPGYPMPLTEVTANLSADFYARLLAADRQYSITRLTSHTSEQFGRRLFAGGIPKLLSLETQRLPELPRFTPLSEAGGRPAQPDELIVNTEFVADYPGMDSEGGLDFDSSNGFYYREIFFHIPYLIAQTLKQEQRFDEAKRWYEYVFDPTSQEGNARFWRYVEFLDDTGLEPLEDQIRAYRDDPFDPHRIAELRPIAYRKAFVMSYIDNLLEWGDMLFRQYTRESIGEATMLYVLAADLLGKKPEELGKRAMSLPDSLVYEQIRDLKTTVLDEELLKLENGVPPVPGNGTPPTIQTPNDSIFNPYFYIPENEQFVSYWNRVGDRLSKIRNGLNIDGVKQALALFAPPVDVMALVQSFASGAGLAQALADYNTPVPHYRFSFTFARARELTGRLVGLGAALLAALEKKDAEELSLLRNTQERSILEMQLQIKQQQLEGARHSLAALQEGLKNAQAREAHYQQLLTQGLSAHEQDQIAQMTLGQVFSQVSNVLSISSSISSFMPQVGSPFAMTYGGQQIGAGIMGMSQAFKSLADLSSFQSSLAATLGGWERRAEDWALQKTLATGDTLQINRQIKAAEIQVEVARQEIQIQRRQIKNNLAIDTFMNSKFTSRQLHQWMAGRLSTVFFQTYHLALQYAKAAQRAMQFELGLPESDVQYVGVGYWDSLKKGLLSGEQLQLDLDRLEKAHLEASQRRLEITRYVSLAQVNPLALTQLKEKGTCEFDLAEALFDCDFPGHYCRQIKSITLSFPALVGPYDNFNATLTQLTHRTLLKADKTALKYLLQGPGQTAGQSGSEPPATVLRVDWRPNQQVALSRGINDGGLFQLNFQDERYLPFEGTGAVSTWRLEVNGTEGQRHRSSLTDVIMTVQYTALAGGEPFTEVVKNAVAKMAQTRACLLNLASDFPDEWQAFMNNPGGGMKFAVERRRLPGATDKKVTGVYLHYELAEDPVDELGQQAVNLNGVALKPGAFKTGLSLPLLEKGQDATKDTNRWKLAPVGASGAKKFNPDNIKNIALVVTYSSKPSF
ncbi:hemopexin repeat-containing protein [Cystobacter ferrugineus]|uniref:Hemopexin n=1 Tax=Cystobacter ferrugineus TaxID=83449 RepID=A0A1L9AV50_9BACT|nr:hemopexin repeat-containing protein [Cystobacter ferrugineus]OJH33892.1 hypothetical protein BON30_46030 [Cystobacter ferrugineus]